MAQICDAFNAGEFNPECDARFLLFLLTNLLSPCYTMLSLVVVASRCNSMLKALASHGKTYTKDLVVNPSYTGDRGIGGKYALSSSPFSLPQCWVSKRYFVHFYLVGLVSTAIATIYHIESYYGKTRNVDTEALDRMNFIRTVAVVVLVIHIARRAYECLYVQQYRNESSKMHFMGYLLGLGHYTVLPLVFWDIDASSIDIISNINITDEVNSFGSRIVSSVTKMNLSSRVFILAMTVILLWLQYEQYKHHVILADIRRVDLIEKKRDDDPSQNRHYSIPPYQRWFRYVLCPHYLAEILLYLSFAILLEMASEAIIEDTTECKNIESKNHENLPTRGRIVTYIIQGTRFRHWTLFGWVATNLTVSAMNSYDWYNSQFKNFNTKNDNPKTLGQSRRPAENLDKRKALLPKFF